MINGIGIPVLTPFKFYPVDVTTGDGVNFQNTDNTELVEQDWEGINPKQFIQPVPRFWNDYSYGIDFQVYLDAGTLAFADLKAAIIDLDGNIEQALVTVDFFTYSGNLKQIRIYAEEFHMDDGCYRIKLYEDSGDDIYYSEVINIADTHDDCYPLEYSNFENDFGLIFENATSDTWVGKMLFPMRMFKPEPLDERKVYTNDISELETLRSLSKRILEIESFPVATWYAEKIKMIFGCSVLELNKYTVNTESTPEIELIPETDVMQIQGTVQLNEFSDLYHQEDHIDTITELLTSWIADGASVGDWTYFNSTGANIISAFYEGPGSASANSNTFSIVTDQWYLIDITIPEGSDLNNMDIYFDGEDWELLNGRNVILHKSSTTGTDKLVLSCGIDTDFSATCSVKKIS